MLLWLHSLIPSFTSKFQRKRSPQMQALVPCGVVCRFVLSVSLLGIASKTSGAYGRHGSIRHTPCVRLFHSSGSVGCRSPTRDGTIGAMVLFRDGTQLESPHLAADIDGVPIIFVLEEERFSKETLHTLKEVPNMAGVLVLARDTTVMEHDIKSHHGYSPDVVTPQGNSTPSAGYTIDASYPWNPDGDGLLMMDLDFPVALVLGDSRDDIRSRAMANGEQHSLQYPVHKAHMTFYFGGHGEDLNSQACLKWENIRDEPSPQCQPIGGESSWASFGPPGIDEKETVIAVTGMDATSMFHQRAPGANSAASGLVSLLAAAEALGSAGRKGILDFSALPRQIVFAAFQAERFGFTGSRRFVQDLTKGVKCSNKLAADESPTGMSVCLDPLYPSLEFTKLGKSAHVLSIDQVGHLLDSTLWLHASPQASPAEQALISEVSIEDGFLVANSTAKELPPTPLTPFVKANSAQSGFVITGYDAAYSSPFFHSTRDTGTTVSSASISAAAALLARSTLLLAGGNNTAAEALRINSTLVETLLYCIMEDWACDMMREYAVGELGNMQSYLGYQVSLQARDPPTLYPGPISFDFGGGLPTVRHTASDGSWRLHPTWPGSFNAKADKIQMVPNLLEIFCRSFLSEQAASGYSGGYGDQECRFSTDCDDMQCDGQGNGGEGLQPAECVRGRCSCPFGFHHMALDVGLERDGQINVYKIVEEEYGENAALWTEVNWRSIGVEVYLDPGPTAGKVALAFGGLAIIVAGIVSWNVQRSLIKDKIL